MLLVTSPAGANGTDFEKILAFTDAGKPLGAFGDDPRVVDPRGLGIDTSTAALLSTAAPIGSSRLTWCAPAGLPGLNPGGGNLGSDGRYYVGLRSERTIMAFARELYSRRICPAAQRRSVSGDNRSRPA